MPKAKKKTIKAETPPPVLPTKEEAAPPVPVPVPGEETDAKERDVLLGRGKRISEWPGNIHFRQVINRYREQYHRSNRKDKVKVAQQVLDDIASIGGRVLQQIKGDKWEIVVQERAIEKACQAMREKEKSRPPETSPFEGLENKVVPPPRAPPAVRPASSKKPKRERTSSTSSPDNEKEQTNGTSNSNGSTNKRAKKKIKEEGKKKGDEKEDKSTSTEDAEAISEREEKTSSEDDELEEEEEDVGKAALQRTAGIERLRKLSDDEMIVKLEEFKQRHGHCAIPPFDCLMDPALKSRDSDFVILADWCTAQRQIYHEIQCKYRKPSRNDKGRIQKLTDMDFCWDFESWHWDQSFAMLQEEFKYAAESKLGLSDEALEWIRDQRQRGRRGMLQGHPERVEKLKSVGVVLTDV